MSEPPAPLSDLDWDAARTRAFAERALDLWQEFLEGLDALPVARGESVAEVRAAVVRPIPDEPLDDDAVFDHLRAVLLEHSTYVGHPRFSGYIVGSGTAPGAIADMLAAGIYSPPGLWTLAPAETEIELALTRWLCAEIGLPEGAGGVFVSGGSMANLSGLKMARDRRGGGDVRRDGLTREVAVYASEQAHYTNARACDTLGLGSGSVRAIAVDERQRMRVDALREAIERDRARGVVPLAVVASAGTTATGAIDPLPEIADLCATHDVWLHVDGAYGAVAVLADDLRPLLAGIERADSVALDPHKWLYVTPPAGCVLARDVRDLEHAFAESPSYLEVDEASRGSGVDLYTRGPALTRPFAALRLWLSLLVYGRRAYAARISHDAALARYLGSLVAEADDFELATPVSLSICCFRYAPPGADVERIDELNRQLVTALQRDGRVYPSNAVVDDRPVLRSCITNVRTEAEDVRELLRVAAERGAELDRALPPAR
jgi:aromatic-L-amino-acid decarboxylase